MAHAPVGPAPAQILTMSLFSRLFRKSDSPAVPPARSKTEIPAEAPKPDREARAREEEASLSQALASGDMAAVAKWVTDGSSTRIRQAAARAITDPGQLRDLIRATRGGKDHTVYKILTAKRDELQAEARAREQLEADVQAAAAAVARHSERPYDATYVASLAQIEARWQALAGHATADVQAEVAGQLERAREVVESYRRAAESEAERKRSAALAAEETRRQRELEAQVAAAAAEEREREVRAARDAEQARREAEEAEARQLVSLLRQAQAALDHGGTGRAARLRDTIKEKLPQATLLPPWFARKLEELDARIGEMKDWKTFTVVPKRAELLAQMQALVGADLAPEELAQRIRHLRDDWRTLSRGAAEEPTPELQEFEEAAERAYEPCREHFAKQAEVRKENQARREALIARLTDFAAAHAGDDVNWRAVQQALVESRREWREYAPVDQAVVKDLQARFHAVVDGLQSRLDAEFERNVQAKRALIARMGELEQLADTRQAIDGARALQQEWRSVGFVPRQQDNVLWEEFRRHCDAVFQRSSQEFAAHNAALEGNQARAVALCEELERTATLTGESLESGMEQLHALRDEFEGLELPRSSARELHQRFSRAVDRCRDTARRERTAAARRGWSDALAAAAKIHAYGLATAQQRSDEDREALRAEATAAVEALAHAPKSARERLDQQLAKVTGGDVSADLAGNEAALRLLCVRAELIADVPSPAEDVELRREYQMQRLVQSMQRGERVTPAELDELALEWIAVGPVEPATGEALLARFERCREAGGR
jgi:hypothetical protein